MFCPQCGQEKISMDTNYCSRCGFPLAGVGELLHTGGVNPLATTRTSTQSPRKRGLKQGLFLFLMTFLVAPLLGMISLVFNAEPIAAGIGVVVCFMGGLLRMAYALMFESSEPGVPTLEEKVLAGANTLSSVKANALPPQLSTPAANYFTPGAGNWRDTNDLQPTSVTESTTQLLDENEKPQ